MSKRGTLQSDDRDISEINISPLIDMVFILLIFFIVTTVFVEEPGVDVERERAVSAFDLERNSILIAVTAADNIVYGGDNIGIGGIRAVVTRLLEGDDMPVILQVDRGSSAGVVVRAIDEAKLGGAKRVSISTETP